MKTDGIPAHCLRLAIAIATDERGGNSGPTSLSQEFCNGVQLLRFHPVVLHTNDERVAGSRFGIGSYRPREHDEQRRTDASEKSERRLLLFAGLRFGEQMCSGTRGLSSLVSRSSPSKFAMPALWCTRLKTVIPWMRLQYQSRPEVLNRSERAQIARYRGT